MEAEMKEDSIFRKYPSIEGVHVAEFLEKIKLNYGNEAYCITEKIHGANTQIDFNLNTGEFIYGKRTDVINENEQCFNVQSILDNQRAKVRELASLLSSYVPDNSEVEVVRVYGEVFGGSYPHPNVPRDKKAIKIQKGVFYSPSNQWRAFDISYSVKGAERNYFLPGEMFFDFANNVGLPTVPLLGIVNSLKAALEYPNDGRSVVFQYYALPEIADNVMEGVVIRPWKKDLWLGQHRVILKNKNEKFWERSKDRRVNIQEEVPEIVKQAMEEVSEFITENRIYNVMSHLGQVTTQDIGKVIELTSKDLLDDYAKSYKTLNLMEKREERVVTKFLQKRVAQLVRKVFMENING